MIYIYAVFLRCVMYAIKNSSRSSASPCFGCAVSSHLGCAPGYMDLSQNITLKLHVDVERAAMCISWASGSLGGLQRQRSHRREMRTSLRGLFWLHVSCVLWPQELFLKPQRFTRPLSPSAARLFRCQVHQKLGSNIDLHVFFFLSSCWGLGYTELPGQRKVSFKSILSYSDNKLR